MTITLLCVRESNVYVIVYQTLLYPAERHLLYSQLSQSAGMHGKPDEYFDILGTGHKDWRLAFRGTAHIQKSVYDAYRDGTGIPYVIEDGCKTIVSGLIRKTRD